MPATGAEMMRDRIDANGLSLAAQAPSPTAAVASTDPTAKPALRRFGRVLRGISAPLGIVVGLVVLRGIWGYPWTAVELRYASPMMATITVAGLVSFCVLPMALLLVARPARIWARLILAALVSIYGYAMVRPAMWVAFAAADYVQYGQIPDDMPGRVASGQEMLRANPDPVAAARRALRYGDTRIYFVQGFVPLTPGVNRHPYTELRYGMREMPGFLDVGAGPAIEAYRSEAFCWVSQYNRELETHLDGLRPVDSLDADCRPANRKG